jgi:hypothetical protein
MTSSILRPVADVVLGRVVVPPVYLPEPRTVQVHRDGRLLGWVTNRVNAPSYRSTVEIPSSRPHSTRQSSFKLA